jgi:integrase
MSLIQNTRGSLVPRALNTDREVYALKPQALRYERAVTKARGLSVLVYPNGCKTFVVRYVAAGGERRRLPIGDYPTLSLATARLKASAIRQDVVEGKDPAAERAAIRAQARFGETLEDLADASWTAAAIGLHGGRRRPLRPATIERQKALWARHVKPVLGKRAFKDLRRADIRAFMGGFVRAGTLSASSIASIGDVVRALFAYALHEDMVEASPALGLTRPIIPESRSRRFGDEAMGVILAALQDAACAALGREDPHARMAPAMALGLRFLILTLTRRTEAAGARWREFNLRERTWTIPAERTKNRQPHVVPLSPQALGVLGDARKLPNASTDGFVFPSPAAAGSHLDAHAMTRAVNRLCVRLGLPLGSPHDFRRTGATVLTGERYAVRRFIVGKVLGHTSHEGPAVTAVYDRNEYLAEKRAALDAWGKHVEGLIPRDPGDQSPQGRRRHLKLVAG